jgi:membrane associated rhomboid family serine protease
MFPIRDHNPSERTPFVSYALIAINIIVFLSYYPSLVGNERQLMAFYFDWALVPAAVQQGMQSHTLITSMFLHGGWMHIAGNMLFLWIFGDNLEDQFGHFWFLVFYLICGVAAGLAQMAVVPTSMVPMVGASGAIAGVMGGYLLLFPKARVDVLVILIIIFKVFTIPAWIMLGLWFGLQLFGGFGADAAGGGVAYWAHVGGFVAGVVLTIPVWLRRGGPAFWQLNHGVPPHDAEMPLAQFRDSPVPNARRSQSEAVTTSSVPMAGRRRPTAGSPWSGGKQR